MRLGLAFALAVMAFAGTAAAQQIARSEDGAVRYQLSQPIGLDAPLDVRDGDAVWAEYIRPMHVVRTTTAGADRPGELRAPGVPAGSILFAYTLRSGFAYCPMTAPGAQRVQCYRDFNDDGQFDGSYVTISRGIDAMVLPGGLRGLNAMPRVSYEQAAIEDAPVVHGQVIFIGFRGREARFRIRIEDEWMHGVRTCVAGDDGLCTVYGVTLRIVPIAGDRARVEFVSSAPQRQLTICFDTEAPRSGCS